ncbi:hypothetical protein [Micrococcus luteus]|uniref:hypothetical protein n=1 Tax=Micrococcus luteus TaxID=1270 RepID=UPI003D352405
MTIVRYDQFRDHIHQRVQTNDTMMGLLAGSKLASQTLRLTEGSKILLSDIFPNVDHVRRFNLTTDKAREVLDDAENLLGILAVPQVLALQEDLIAGMLRLLKIHVPNSGTLPEGDLKAARVHETLQTKTGGQFTQETLYLFHLVRLARNAHIHNGGKAGTTIVNGVESASSATLATWKKITRSEFPHYSKGDPVQMGLSELIGILAVSKRLADEANHMLQTALPKTAWADIAVADWLRHARPGDKNQRNRQLLGLVRLNYKPIGLTQKDLDEAKMRAHVA